MQNLSTENNKELNKIALRYIKENKLSKALKILNQILKINPENTTALCNKGVAFSKLGKYQKALRYYDLTLNYDPNFEIAKVNRSKLLLKVQITANRTQGIADAFFKAVIIIGSILCVLLFYLFIFLLGR